MFVSVHVAHSSFSEPGWQGSANPVYLTRAAANSNQSGHRVWSEPRRNIALPSYAKKVQSAMSFWMFVLSWHKQVLRAVAKKFSC